MTTARHDTVHDVLVVLIVASRVLIWDGAPGQFAETAWQALVLLGLVVALLEGRPFVWGWRGGIAAALVAALAVSASMSVAPGVAWCRFSGWMGCLAAAAYLMQVIDGRRRLAVAALGAGLAGEALLALTQRLWVLPAMAQAQQQGGGAFAGLGLPSGDIAERVALGGVFGSFTLANQLAIWLVLVGVALGRVWWLAVLALAALWFTDAKGAWLALVAVLGYAWWLRVPGWWRWLPLAVGLVALVVAGARLADNASVAVRLGYWQGAWELFVRQSWTGHGLGGFAAQFPQVMAVGAEPTQFAHNEIIEGLVSGGVGLGLLVTAWLVALAVPRRSAPLDEQRPVVAWLAAPVAVLVLYLTLIRALDGNVGWWPMPRLVGGCVVGLVMAGAFVLLRRVAVPGGLQCTAAATALALGSLIDFHGQSSALWGTAAVVLVLTAPVPQGRAVWPTAVLAVLLSATTVVGALWGSRLRQVEELLMLDRQALSDPAARDDILAIVGEQPNPHQALMERLWPLAAGQPSLRLQIVMRCVDPALALAWAQELVQQAPASAGSRRELARRLAQSGDWPAAVAAGEQAVRLAPTDPRQYRDQAELLEAAVRRLPQHAEWRTAAAAASAEAERLTPLVHPRLR